MILTIAWEYPTERCVKCEDGRKRMEERRGDVAKRVNTVECWVRIYLFIFSVQKLTYQQEKQLEEFEKEVGGEIEFVPSFES